jgi:hypothetical protein
MSPLRGLNFIRGFVSTNISLLRSLDGAYPQITPAPNGGETIGPHFGDTIQRV